MKFSRKGIVRNIILATVITVVVLALIIFLDNFSATAAVLSTTDGISMIYALLLALAYFVLYPIPLVILTRFRHQHIPGWKAYLIGASEHFFNDITPFATGGQPFQVYALAREKIQARESTGILLMNYITFMLATNIFAIASLAFYRQFTAKIPDFLWIVIFGFSINFLVLVFFFVMVFSVRFRDLMIKAMRSFCSIGWIRKRLGDKINDIDAYFIGAQVSAQQLLRRPFVFILILTLKLVTMAIYYLIPYFILQALHVALNPADIWYVMAGTSFASTIVVWIPTPGSSGGIELAFKSIFISFQGVTEAIGLSSMLLWRLIAYYLIACLSCLAYLIINRFGGRKEQDRPEKESGLSSRGPESELTESDKKAG